MNSQMLNIEAELEEFVQELRIVTDDDYYQELYDFVKTNNSISLIVDKDYNLTNTEFNINSIEVTNTTTYETYDIQLTETITSIREMDRIVALISQADNNYYEAHSLKVNNEIIFDFDCDNCIEVRGLATKVHSPVNLNAFFSNNQVALSERFRLKSLDSFEDSIETEFGNRWINDTEFSQNIVYLHKINNSDYLLTIYVLQSSENVLDILSTYNFSIYAVMIALAFIISIIVSNMISKPITKINDVAKEIAQLNFDVRANEKQNKETASLTESINTMAQNLRTNINKLSNTNKEVIELYEKQTKQVELRKNFISAISHELKTPLMVMNVTVQGILDGIYADNEEEAELYKVLAEITNLNVMIKDLLDVFKLDELDIKDDLDKINLKTTSEEILESVVNLTNQYEQVITLDSIRSPIIFGDRKLMHMVLSNIITNAIKYTPNKETIKISIEEHRNIVSFSCTNYGVTIPKESLEHIFEPFYRVDESRTKTSKTKGTGLGLYIVSETLKAHNFEFGVENVKNGVKFWFNALKNQK